ncbi:hypothetical protein HELRODRAFT_159085 [Helobdella robusta]|uniref:Uncharacterized protein n=1 Tax=Helobdella robusta TaxID=6412 RepID=T1ENK5_HELRO|nr:hypothetical protein HELRODRAFT_159085 [Helobdella robusta]ESO12529.1 hypothetical protein HELRODRAFT_159085 [Helobdella robusta]
MKRRDMDIHKTISNAISSHQTVLDSINQELKDLDEQEKNRKRKFQEISLHFSEEIVVQENLGISKLEATISANQETSLRKEEIIKDLQNRLKQADSRIVKSPFRLQQTIEHYKKKLPDQIHGVEEAVAKYREEREGLRHDCERKSKEAVKNFSNVMDNAVTEWKDSVVTVKNKTSKNKKTMEAYHSLINKMQASHRDLEDQCSGKEQLLKNFQASLSKYDEHLSVLLMKSNKAVKEHQEDYASYCDSIKRFELLVKEQERKIFNKFMDHLKFIQKNSIYKTDDV